MESGIAAIYKSSSTVFTHGDLAAIWEIPNYDYLKTRIQYYVKRGYLRRICHGLYAKKHVKLIYRRQAINYVSLLM